MNFQSNQKVIYVLVAALVVLVGVSIYLIFASQQKTPTDAGVSTQGGTCVDTVQNNECEGYLNQGVCIENLCS